MNCTKEELLLYAVTDRSWLHGRTLKEQVKEALDGGVTFLQLREKQIDSELFLQEAQELKELCKQYQVPFVINDDVELALKVDATACMSDRAIWRQAMSGKNSEKIRLSVYRHRP